MWVGKISDGEGSTGGRRWGWRWQQWLPIPLLLTCWNELSPLGGSEGNEVSSWGPFSSSFLHSDAVSEAMAGTTFGCIIAACWFLSLWSPEGGHPATPTPIISFSLRCLPWIDNYHPLSVHLTRYTPTSISERAGGVARPLSLGVWHRLDNKVPRELKPGQV